MSVPQRYQLEPRKIPGASIQRTLFSSLQLEMIKFKSESFRF
jgi:hypothetical protein